MKRFLQFSLVLLFSVFLFNACTVNNVTVDEKIGDIFKSNGVTGTFGMFDNSRGEFTLYDLDRFKLAKSPGQTFHIFSSLVALHTGKLADDSLGLVVKDSLASIIGREKLQYWIDSIKYGNKKIGTDLNSFWMNDSLKISPDEQLGLMKRLYFKQHPFRGSVQEAVKKMMIVENNAQHQLAYQLATIPRGQKKQAWVMGWIEENRHVYPFVISYDADAAVNTDVIGPKLAKDILNHIGFFKGIM